MICPHCKGQRHAIDKLASSPLQYEYVCCSCGWGLRYYQRADAFIEPTQEEIDKAFADGVTSNNLTLEKLHSFEILAVPGPSHRIHTITGEAAKKLLNSKPVSSEFMEKCKEMSKLFYHKGRVPEEVQERIKDKFYAIIDELANDKELAVSLKDEIDKFIDDL